MPARTVVSRAGKPHDEARGGSINTTMKKLPPLNPLKVFEAVARANSITNASKELFVTQSAVSRQIYVLEDYLQVQLFIHRRGKITLTDQGRAYFQAISPAFHKIGQATSDLLKNKDPEVVRVITYQTFALHWLIPRLAEFRRAHPEVELHVATQVQPVGDEDANTDVFIQFGSRSWPGYTATKLLPDVIEPVCSPEFKARHRIGDDPAELADFPLLFSNYRRRDWADWLEHVGLEDILAENTIHFRSSGLAFKAAVEGLGIAMGQPRLVSDEIRTGYLTTVYDRPLKRNYAYYLLRAKNVNMHPAAKKFIAWVSGIAKREQEAD